MASLIERSLIQRLPDSTGGTRYQVHELVRSYSLERLQRAAKTRLRMCVPVTSTSSLSLVERANAVWESPDGPVWQGRIRLDQANIDVAMLWALDRHDVDRALRMAAARTI